MGKEKVGIYVTYNDKDGCRGRVNGTSKQVFAMCASALSLQLQQDQENISDNEVQDLLNGLVRAVAKEWRELNEQ